ncbi:MAG: c-type cytochrome [Proteobacteria bacterium]|nr:c-type cytochrome [Pseudomonadota bacterium]
MSSTAIDDTTASAATSSDDNPTTGKVLEHEYDGIHEYDNPLPGWWRAIFYGSMIYALVYFIIFVKTDWIASPEQTYRAAALEWSATHEASSTAMVSASEDQLAAGARDPAMVERGQTIFTTKCATCHTPDGRGLIGPNLTDLFQIHGSKREDLFNTIRDGAPGTAMMPWGTQLPATDLVAVASFVSSLRGKNVAGKEPQGNPVPAFAP